jgi:DNA-binding MarR family transcriptional regulator
VSPTLGLRELKVLKALMESASPEDRSTARLAERLEMDVDSVTAALTGLESVGFAEKGTDASDLEVWSPVGDPQD